MPAHRGAFSALAAAAQMTLTLRALSGEICFHSPVVPAENKMSAPLPSWATQATRRSCDSRSTSPLDVRAVSRGTDRPGMRGDVLVFGSKLASNNMNAGRLFAAR